MATTTNFGWETPDDTDLVKDGALAMRTLGNAIDASLVDLKGGTTGQVLSKNSNTDMDFTWVTSDDANAIQNDIVDAKGDLITATAADTPSRLAVGNNGETLLADSASSTGLRWAADWNTGKNKIINGDFGIWQRGTTFNNVTNVYTSDRFSTFKDGTATVNVTRQTFTPGSAPVAGYEGQFFLRNEVTSWTSSDLGILQRIEDVRTFAGQNVVVSFWAKADVSFTNTVLYVQNFGTGGSAAVIASQTHTIGTTWARHSLVFSIPSISGKTIGTNNVLEWQILRYAAARTVDIWGVQIESGNVATPFTTATGTLAGELAACQRYYWRNSSGTGAFPLVSTGYADSATLAYFPVLMPTEMRIAPTAVEYSSLRIYDASVLNNVTNVTLGSSTAKVANISATVSGLTTGRACALFAGSTGSPYIGLSAEL